VCPSLLSSVFLSTPFHISVSSAPLILPCYRIPLFTSHDTSHHTTPHHTTLHDTTHHTTPRHHIIPHHILYLDFLKWLSQVPTEFHHLSLRTSSIEIILLHVLSKTREIKESHCKLLFGQSTEHFAI
jgi:hypothetical protein